MTDVAEPKFDTLKAFASAPNLCPTNGMLSPHAAIDYPKEMARGTSPQPALYRVGVTRIGESLTYELHICRHCGLVYATVEHSNHGL